MMKKNFPAYLHTKDRKRIFYNTNFDPRTPDDSNEPLIVFNYGLVCSIGHWSEQIPYFDEKGHKILLHNYRGHYNSSGDDDLESCHFENFASDLHKIINTLNISSSQKIIMLGHSMGVNVTLEYACRYPSQISGMVLVSGTLVSPQETMFDSQIMSWVFPIVKILSQQFPKLFQNIWETNSSIPLIQRSILNGGFNPQQVPIEFIQQYLNRIKRLPPQLFMHLFEEMSNHNIQSRLSKLKVPTLIIGGEKDKIVPNHFQELLLQIIPHSEFYLVKDGSHVPQVDFPELINERIHSFINKCTHV